jgi:cytochrome c oxidase cbb3-type subunit 3
MTTEPHENTTRTPTDDHLMEHAYDGIQEYDNPLPRWWLAIFWVTIVFTPLYILFFHFGPGMLAHERYDRAMMLAAEQQMAAILALGEIDEAMIAGLMDDPSMMNGGKKVFTAKCATCHGMLGEGGIGPNLTDEYWLHGAQLMDVYRTIREGVTDKGMLAWERQLRPAELLAVTAHVGGLLGTAPADAKDPQGERVTRMPPETPAGGETMEGGEVAEDAAETSEVDA